MIDSIYNFHNFLYNLPLYTSILSIITRFRSAEIADLVQPALGALAERREQRAPPWTDKVTPIEQRATANGYLKARRLLSISVDG